MVVGMTPSTFQEVEELTGELLVDLQEVSKIASKLVELVRACPSLQQCGWVLMWVGAVDVQIH